MSKSSRPKPDDAAAKAKRAAKRARNKASYIRVKLRNGEAVTDEDQAFLAAWDASTHGNAADPDPDPAGAPPPPDDGALPPDDGEPGPDDAKAGGPLPTPPTPPRPSPALPPLGAVPSTGRALTSAARPSGGKGGKGAWRDKYGYLPEGADADDGREAVCQTLGSWWLATLTNVSDAIKEAGITPLIDVQAPWLAGAIVLTVDKVLPPEVEVTPEVVAVGGTSALLVQRLIRSKAIKEAQERKGLDAARARSGPIPQAAAPPPDPAHPSSPPPDPAPLPPPTQDEVNAAVAARAPGVSAGEVRTALARPRFDPGGLS